MDGKLLAQAREEKERIRLQCRAEEERRRGAALARIPELAAVDTRLRALVDELAGTVLGGGRDPERIWEESRRLTCQRRELLQRHGYPGDWLDGVWQCPVCRDTGYTEEGRVCDCLRELYEKQRARSLSALLRLGGESFSSFQLGYYDEVPGAREQMELIFSFCRDYAEHFGDQTVSLLFRGDPGLGKTFLSACIARKVSEQGFSVVYVTIVEALASYEDLKFRAEPQAAARVDRLEKCDLLILDDLGTEMVTDFTRSALYTLINNRLLAGRKTIVSTNLSREALARLYTPQIASRLDGEYQEMPFVGRDIRKIRRERGL